MRSRPPSRDCTNRTPVQSMAGASRFRFKTAQVVGAGWTIVELSEIHENSRNTAREPARVAVDKVAANSRHEGNRRINFTMDV